MVHGILTALASELADARGRGAPAFPIYREIMEATPGAERAAVAKRLADAQEAPQYRTYSADPQVEAWRAEQGIPT